MALYDTLGKEAFKFVIDQTQLTSMAITIDLIPKIAKLKMEDAKCDNQNLFRLKHLIVFENNIGKEDRELA